MNQRERLDALQDLATELHGSDDVEIYYLPTKRHISEITGGIWVRAWVFVDNADLAEAGIHNPEAN